MKAAIGTYVFITVKKAIERLPFCFLRGLEIQFMY